jgi:hypothetical protein
MTIGIALNNHAQHRARHLVIVNDKYADTFWLGHFRIPQFSIPMDYIAERYRSENSHSVHFCTVRITLH